MLVTVLVWSAVAVGFVMLIGGAVGGALGINNSQTVSCVPAAQAPGATGFALPMEPGSYTLTSGFGPRWGSVHRGQDFGAPAGTPIMAAAPGKVIRAGPAGGFGQWIVIKHTVNGKRFDTVYGHMWPSGVGVERGQVVSAGQVIGQVGSNGQSTGPHLHFEIWPGGRFAGGHAVDPMPKLSTPPPDVPAPGDNAITRLASGAAPGSQQLPAPTAATLMPNGPNGPQSSLSIEPFQQKYVDAIVGVGKSMDLPPQAWVIAVATAMTESRLLMYANSTVPASLSIPHDAVGSDHDSVGLFQQRPSWGTLEERMDPAISARLFYQALQGVPNWRDLPLAVAAQSVQRSAFPDAYAEWEVAAANAVRASYGAPPLAGTAGVGACVPSSPLSGSTAECGLDLSGLGDIKPWVTDAARYFGCQFGKPVMHGVGPRPNPSDHPRGLALDFMVDRRTGDALASCALNNWEALDIKYMIWRQRITFGSGWERMADRGGPTANHMDHVHVSFEDSANGRAPRPCDAARRS